MCTPTEDKNVISATRYEHHTRFIDNFLVYCSKTFFFSLAQNFCASEKKKISLMYDEEIHCFVCSQNMSNKVK